MLSTLAPTVIINDVNVYRSKLEFPDLIHLKQPMFKFILAILALTLAGGAMAADATCMAQVTEKKLAGAAKTSFTKKCEKDAKAICETASAEKKLET